MALSKITTDLNVIQKLSNLPNETDGLTPAKLKAKFDESVNDIKTYLNDTLTEEVDDALAGISSGVPSGSQLGTNKILDDAITSAKLCKTDGKEAVITTAIRDGAVTADKLSDEIPVSTFSGQITTDMLPDSIPAENLPAITADMLPDIPSDKLPDIPSDKLPDITADDLPSIPSSKLTSVPASIIDGQIPASQISDLPLGGFKHYTFIPIMAGKTSGNTVISTKTDVFFVQCRPGSFALWDNCKVRISNYVTYSSETWVYFTSETAPTADVKAMMFYIDGE